MSELSDVFERAQESLRERGHCASAMDGPDGSRCAMGHITDGVIAARAYGWVDHANDLLRDYIARNHPDAKRDHIADRILINAWNRTASAEDLMLAFKTLAEETR